ncbi:MAG TPA: hypothetical protein VIY73_22045, partial [Polyangiaceae bacterium]
STDSHAMLGALVADDRRRMTRASFLLMALPAALLACASNGGSPGSAAEAEPTGHSCPTEA